MFSIEYCYLYEDHLKEEWKTICQTFTSSVKLHYPELLKRPKIHLILHLVDCMAQYGPTSAYSAERFEFIMLTLYSFIILLFLFSCESFNADVLAQNIYSNRLAPHWKTFCSIAVCKAYH